MEFIANNFPMIATILAFVAGVILYGRNRAIFEWINETLFMAFDNAEKKGILEGLSGEDKLTHYLTIWRDAYSNKFGKNVTGALENYAIKKAEELALKEKEIRDIVDSMADPK